MDIDPHRIITHPLTAGIGGALAGLRFAPGATLLERAFNVVSGAACAGWLAPAAVSLFDLTSVSAESAMAFLIGMFGMSIAAAVMEAVRAVKLAEILTGWISRK